MRAVVLKSGPHINGPKGALMSTKAKRRSPTGLGVTKRGEKYLQCSHHPDEWRATSKYCPQPHRVEAMKWPTPGGLTDVEWAQLGTQTNRHCCRPQSTVPTMPLAKPCHPMGQLSAAPLTIERLFVWPYKSFCMWTSEYISWSRHPSVTCSTRCRS